MQPVPTSILATLLALALGACRLAPLPHSVASTSTLSPELTWSDLPLGPNDIVRVGVWGHPELSTPLSGTQSGAVGSRIDGSGKLSLPLVGAVDVGGIGIDLARERIRAAYATYVQDPKVDVSVVEYGARRFYLFGEVNQAGSYVIDRPMTLYQALSLGKGFTTRADRERVVLLRGGPDTLEVHSFSAETPGLQGLMALRPDDLVFVRRTGTGKFTDEILPILQGISSALSSAATLVLIDDQLNN